MKTSKLISGLVFLTIISGFWSCDKTEEFVLPKETTSGENTLGFKVDGEVFLRRKNSLLEPYNITAGYRNPNGLPYFQIVARCEDANGNKGSFGLNIPAPIRIGEKQKLRTGSFSAYQIENDGEIEFTRFDTIARVASGRFSFAPIYNRTGEVIFITEGRFDVKLIDD